MSKGHNRQMRGLPSLRALYIFEAASRHLNLIRAAEELGLTQGALSRQIRSLEDHVGVPLFIRTPRGLKSTEAGDVLRNHCGRAFRELQEGLGTISAVRGRQTLLVAVARSYSTRVLSHRIAGFVQQHPWIDLVLDGHRHLADLSRNEADAAIRVGDGQWQDATCEKIEDDPLFPVAAPSLVAACGSDEIGVLADSATLLHFTERPYWDLWTKAAGVALPAKSRSVRFSETVMMIEAAEAGQGVAIARQSLVREALAVGRLVRLSPIEVDDGIGYFFCTTPEGARKETVRRFRDWVFEQVRAA
jgi:DNA-binding transcriptional LysR family regulator